MNGAEIFNNYLTVMMKFMLIDSVQLEWASTVQHIQSSLKSNKRVDIALFPWLRRNDAAFCNILSDQL